MVDAVSGITAMSALYTVVSFILYVILLKFIGGYILNKVHRPFGWIPSVIAAAVIMVIQGVIMSFLTFLVAGTWFVVG